jgi:hypothetical protein
MHAVAPNVPILETVEEAYERALRMSSMDPHDVIEMGISHAFVSQTEVICMVTLSSLGVICMATLSFAWCMVNLSVL